MGAAAHLAADEAGVLERLDVLRGGGQRDGERLGELPDRALPAGERAEHPAAGGVAEGVEDRVEFGRLKFNHVVEYERAEGEKVNRLVE